MLISYPVLPPAAVDDDEEIFLANILGAHLLEYEGRYPVSTMDTARGPMHRWHGGVHLYGGGEPVRAIADGTVVAFRFAAQSETYGELGAYDTGFVLLRHETQTGENTTVVFYSLYMHLASQASLAADRLVQLPPWLRQSTGPAVRRPANQRVWRKDSCTTERQCISKSSCSMRTSSASGETAQASPKARAATTGLATPTS